jgi:DNA-binding response OmpR family regulator
MRRRLAPLPPQLRIATIDRDRAFLQKLSDHVDRIGWTLRLHPEPVSEMALLDGDPHVLLVDIRLLGPHWDEWLEHRAAHLPHLGLVVCTGGSEMLERVRGLRAGADDWVTKPCHIEELCARLQAIARGRRHGALVGAELPLLRGELEIRPDLHDVIADDRRAGLTGREFDLLLCLAREDGAPIEREVLYRTVWGFEMARGDRSIDTFVRKIRGKLTEVSPGWRYIQTHRGRGYGFAVARARSGDEGDGGA